MGRLPHKVDTASKMFKYGYDQGMGVFKKPLPKRKPFNERVAERLRAQESRPDADGIQGGKVE